MEETNVTMTTEKTQGEPAAKENETKAEKFIRIGININQIVFNNNAGLYSKEDKTQLVAYMRKLNKKVNEAVVQIGNQ